MKYTPEQLQKFSNFIKEGHNIKVASEKSKINPKSAYYLLKKLNIAPVNKFSKYRIKGDYFDIIDTEHKAYFLGLIIADGYISLETKKVFNGIGTNFRLGISLQEEDSYIIDIFSKELGFEKEIKLRDYQGGVKARKKQRVFRFSNKHLVSALIGKYKILPRKTFDNSFQFPFEKIPQKLVKHFIRGFFDGDGSVSFYLTKKTLFFNFSFVFTSENFMNQFSDIFSEKFEIIPVKKRHLGKSIDWFSLRFNYSRNRTNKIVKIYNWLYEDATIFMSRKKQKFENYFKYRGNQKDNERPFDTVEHSG